MTIDDIISMAKEADLWGEIYAMQRFAKLVAAAEREVVASWMMRHEYATGNGDTIEDLLDELEWQIKEQWERAALVERFKIKQKYPFLFTADEFEIISNAAIAEGAAAERDRLILAAERCIVCEQRRICHETSKKNALG